MAKQTAGVILRELVNFAAAGGEEFFGEPEFDLQDLLRTGDDGRGTITLLELPGVHDKPKLVFFVTQTPKDVHEDVLSQLGSRVQHQLRAFIPHDAAALKASVRTYPTSFYDLEQVLQELGIG